VCSIFISITFSSNTEGASQSQRTSWVLRLIEVIVLKYANNVKVPDIKIGSRWRFDKGQIDELLRDESESQE